MKRLSIIVVLFLSIGASMAVRSWLLQAKVSTNDEAPVEPKLPPEFDDTLARIQLLRQVHEKKRPNQPGDWLERYPENGQTFAQYVQFLGIKPLRDDFTAIDVQPLGDFNETQRRIVTDTADFLVRFFGVAVRLNEPVELGDIRDDAHRMRDEAEQLLTTWIMDDRLVPLRQSDSIATIGLVTTDLWGANLNWVFGQASIKDRVAVLSLHRNGDPRDGEAEYRLCLLRTLKTVVHEAGHAIGMPHCGALECGMNGSRSIEEHDRRMLEFCPDCQAKIWWTCRIDPIQRCESLCEFCERKGLEFELKQFCREKDLLLRPATPP